MTRTLSLNRLGLGFSGWETEFHSLNKYLLKGVKCGREEMDNMGREGRKGSGEGCGSTPFSTLEKL